MVSTKIQLLKHHVLFQWSLMFKIMLQEFQMTPSVLVSSGSQHLACSITPVLCKISFLAGTCLAPRSPRLATINHQWCSSGSTRCRRKKPINWSHAFAEQSWMELAGIQSNPFVGGPPLYIKYPQASFSHQNVNWHPPNCKLGRLSAVLYIIAPKSPSPIYILEGVNFHFGGWDCHGDAL